MVLQFCHCILRVKHNNLGKTTKTDKVITFNNFEYSTYLEKTRKS